jgi:O-antigen/teichoic acid export membrane protein
MAAAKTMTSLSQKAVSGVLWSTGLNVFRDFLQFGLMLVLVRLLAPEAYGQFGLVNAIMGFLTVFSFRSFLEHTLQVRPGAEVDYQLHFTAGVFLQVAMFLLANAAAEIFRHIGKFSEIANLLHIMSFLFLLDVGHEFRVKMLEREMNWQRLRTIQAIGVVASAALSLLMAAAGAGVYALLVPTLLGSLPAFVDLFVIQRWRPTWRWDLDAFLPIWRYGIARLGSGIALWTRQLLESTFLVQLVGFAAYGIYGRAIGLATLCCLKVPWLLSQALFPVLTKLVPGSSSFSRATSLVFCSVAWATFPAVTILSVLAKPVILTLYGPRWADAIPFVPWAMGLGAAMAMAQMAAVLLIANLQQKFSLYMDVVSLCGVLLCLVLLAPRGLKLYLAGTAAVQIAILLLMLARLYRDRVIDLRGVAGSLVLPALCSAASLGALEFGKSLLDLSMETWKSAVVFGVLFSLIYLVLLRLTSGRQCREMVSFLPGGSHLQRWLLLGV